MPSIKPIICPKCKRQGWPGDTGFNCGKLTTGETVIQCVCGESFILPSPHDYKMLSGNYFVRIGEASNHVESGSVKLLPGHATEVLFKQEFDYPCKAVMTPNANVYVKDYYLSKDRMIIMCSYSSSAVDPKQLVDVSWIVYGLADIDNLPSWYVLLYSAMTENANWLFKAALLSYASSFEAFLEEYLSEYLKMKYGEELSEYLLKETWQIEKRCNKLLKLATGHSLSEDNEIYQPWHKNVKEKRDRLMHGVNIPVSQEDAENAHRATYQAIRWIQNLRI